MPDVTIHINTIIPQNVQIRAERLQRIQNALDDNSLRVLDELISENKHHINSKLTANENVLKEAIKTF